MLVKYQIHLQISFFIPAVGSVSLFFDKNMVLAVSCKSLLFAFNKGKDQSSDQHPRHLVSASIKPIMRKPGACLFAIKGTDQSVHTNNLISIAY